MLAPAPLIWVAFRDVDAVRAWNLAATVGASLVWVLLPMAAAMAVDTAAWRIVFASLGRRLSLLRLLGVRIASEAVLLSVSGGSVLADAVAPYLLKRYGDVPLPVTVAGTALRKVALLAAQSICLAAGVLVGWEFLRAASPAVIGAGGLPVALLAVSAGLMLVALAAAGGLTRGGLAGRVHALLERLPGRRVRLAIRRIRRGFTRTDESLERFAAGGGVRWVAPVGLYVSLWLAECLETYVILRLLGVDLGFVAVWAFEPAVVLLRHLAFFVPGGLGVQELGYLAFLRAAGVDAPVETSLAFSAIKRAREALWVGLGYGVLALSEGLPSRARAARIPARGESREARVVDSAVPAAAAAAGGREGASR